MLSKVLQAEKKEVCERRDIRNDPPYTNTQMASPNPRDCVNTTKDC